MSMSLTKQALNFRRVPQNLTLRAMFSGGKDAEAGSIRGGGGSFAKREQAQEDQYFRRLQQEQIKNLKGHLDEEVSHHESEIKRHQARIQQLKEKATELEKENK